MASLTPPIQIHADFEFLGTADGKVFIRPIYAEPYGHGTDDLTYQDAIAKCASAGYRIATIESAAQNDAVENHTCTRTRWSWIDGVDFVVPDAFFSLNTGKNLTYFNWSRWGQRPIIGKDDRNCIRISCNSVEGAAWWDVTCTDKYSVICEVPI